jgi:endonuclease/exonuclease/phosphatase family metal-dependent hydrolase
VEGTAAEHGEEASPGTIQVRALTWNLYHGRDAPPGHARRSFLSRLLRRELDDGEFLEVNRSLEREFAGLIALAAWSVCLLQETPPRWARTLATKSEARDVRFLTSRNELQRLTSVLARWNPDAIGSWEGGSNLTLVRAPWQVVEGSERSLILNPFPARGLHERRCIGFVRLRAHGARGQEELCVGNIHASTRSAGDPEREVLTAARALDAWAGGAPVLLGGDFNLRPRETSVFDQLERELGLAPATAPEAIDHLLVRGLDVIEPPMAWPPERRDIEVRSTAGVRRIRLSDHAPVEGAFAFPPRCDTT